MGNRKMKDLRKEFRYANSNARFGISADVAGHELARIERENGHLTAQVVVDTARPETAALHPAFEWDDEVAAELYRKKQASSLIRAVVEVPGETSDIPEHRAYCLTMIESENRPVYMAAAAVIESPSLFADAIGRLQKSVLTAQSSLHELQELASRHGAEPERMLRIGLAVTALEAANAAVAALH